MLSHELFVDRNAFQIATSRSPPSYCASKNGPNLCLVEIGLAGSDWVGWLTYGAEGLDIYPSGQVYEAYGRSQRFHDTHSTRVADFVIPFVSVASCQVAGECLAVLVPYPTSRIFSISAGEDCVHSSVCQCDNGRDNKRKLTVNCKVRLCTGCGCDNYLGYVNEPNIDQPLSSTIPTP